MEFLVDTFKGIVRLAIYVVVFFVAEQYVACNMDIPLLQGSIVPGVICDGVKSIPDDDESNQKDYKPIIIGKIQNSADLVTTNKEVENLVFSIENVYRSDWERLNEGNNNWWETFKDGILNPEVFFRNLTEGREITIRVSGRIYGKVDLNGMDTSDITEEVSDDILIYTVHTPASGIFNVDVTPESIEIIGDDMKVIVGLNLTLFANSDEFKTDAIKQSKQKILDELCNEEFMENTADNAKATLEGLLSGVTGKNRVVVDVPVGRCALP